MLYQVLGPLLIENSIRADIRPIARKARQLLALLLYKANKPVSPSWLIDHLWDGRPPPSGASNLKTYITRLRRALAPATSAATPVQTRADGYLLAIGPDDLDAVVFERLAGQGQEALRTGDLYHAVATLERAVGLWRGDLLQGLELCGPLTSWAEGLHEERRMATENLFDARLALGRHHEVTASLTVWTAKHPLRERAHAQLMLALYRSGQQREALDTYQRLRASLINRIGAEPTPALRQLQHRILEADPKLELTPTISLIMERARETIQRASSPQPRRALDSVSAAMSYERNGPR